MSMVDRAKEKAKNAAGSEKARGSMDKASQKASNAVGKAGRRVGEAMNKGAGALKGGTRGKGASR